MFPVKSIQLIYLLAKRGVNRTTLTDKFVNYVLINTPRFKKQFHHQNIEGDITILQSICVLRKALSPICIKENLIHELNV